MRLSFVIPVALLAVLTASLTPVSARAAEATAVTVGAPSPAEPRYSQAIAVTAHLARASGAAIAGTECQNNGAGQPCRVEVSIARASAPDDVAAVFDPPTDTNGDALVRITFVDGRYTIGGQPFDFVADDTGAPYVLTFRFRGKGDGLITEPDCTTPDTGGLCPSLATVEVPLFLETAEISLGAGLEGGLGDTITLSAELQDPTGEAAAGGTDVDGNAPLVLAGRSVAFFYDADNNGRPDASELIDRADTNASGVASLTFTLNPDFVRAGTFENGIHAEFGGDDRYGVARASARLVVRPGSLDVASTILEADPKEIPADNFTKTTIRARLVDRFNNPLDETSEPHELVFTTTAGRLLGEVERDPATGTYSQELQAQIKPDTATVSVTIDGEEGPAIDVVMTGEEGGCSCASAGAPLSGLALVVLAVVRTCRRRQVRA